MGTINSLEIFGKKVDYYPPIISVYIIYVLLQYILHFLLLLYIDFR